jgi:hypothetical protein
VDVRVIADGEQTELIENRRPELGPPAYRCS